MMKQVAFTELRSHAKTYFDFAESGETIRVLRNGKPIAGIVPGIADLPAWKRLKAQPLLIGGGSVCRLIPEERGSRSRSRSRTAGCRVVASSTCSNQETRFKSNMTSKRVLVTVGAGFLGAHPFGVFLYQGN